MFVISKVEGPGSVRNSSSVRRTGKSAAAESASFSQHLDEEGMTPVAGVSSLAGVGGIGAIIGVQEVGDATERAARGRKRAHLLLAQLEDLRLALINGTLGMDQLVRLARMVQSEKVKVDDPHLAGALDDIDLRVRVELAKYGL